MSEQQRYPLSWPIGWKRTTRYSRKTARFGTQESGRIRQVMTVSRAIDRLDDELRMLRASHVILSSNLELGIRGNPLSNQREPDDAGVAVYFDIAGKPRVLACDRWTRVADNITAIAMHIRAIRAVDRYGVGSMEQAFAGYTALPASPHDWWIVLQVSQDATTAQVDDAYRRLARQSHPDVGGSHDLMARLNAARDEARKAGR